MWVRRFLMLLSVVGIASLCPPAQAQEDQTLSPKQAEAVRRVIRDYLMEHPEVLQEALEALRDKMRQQAEVDSRHNIESYKADLFDNKDDPVSGNAKGDLTIVEFFDYNCAFCKSSYDGLMDTVKSDGKIKLVFKELPILTEDSVVAARIALSAKKQGKYDDVHRAFMKFRGKLDSKTAYRLAGEAGVNLDQVKKDEASPEFDKLLRRNQELAHALGVEGTPAFIIGDRLVAQALDASTLKQLTEVARRTKPIQ